MVVVVASPVELSEVFYQESVPCLRNKLECHGIDVITYRGFGGCTGGRRGGCRAGRVVTIHCDITIEAIGCATAAIVRISGTILVALRDVDIRCFVWSNVRTPTFASLYDSECIIRGALCRAETVGLVDTRV